MENRYKFRGKTIEGKWMYGDLVQWKSKGICAILPQDGSQWSNPYDFEVIPETVGQFTGKMTMDGNEVYEGDIVSDLLGETMTVEWNDDTCKFQYDCGLDINDNDTYGVQVVVTGNIHNK